MRIVLTKHAAEQIARRKLDLRWVERVALHPDWIRHDPAPGVFRHFGAIAEFGGRVLRVPVVDQGSERRVVSAFFDRGERQERS